MSDTAPAAPLKSLTLEGGVLHPGSSAERLCYFSDVPHARDALAIRAEATDAAATVAIGGASAQAGVAVATVRLAVGRTLVDIVVSGPGGTTTYTLKVFRAQPTPDWEKMAETLPWSPRDSAGELVYHDRLWLFGGYTPALVNDVWSSADGVTWTRAGNLPCPSGVNIPITFVHDDRMWVVSQEGKLFASRDGAAWTLVTDRAPWKGRYAAGKAVFAGRMWVLGGLQMQSGTMELFNDVWSSADGVTWTREVAEAPWSRRQLFGMVVVHGGKLWILGGGITNYHPFRAYTDVWCSSDGRHWEQVTAAAPWPARIWSDAVVYRNRLWVLGGFRGEPTWNNFDDVWYSADGAAWHKLETETIWSPRHEVSPYVLGDTLWVHGGNAWPLVNDAWRLRIDGLCFVTRPPIEEFVGTPYTYRARADFNASARPVRYRLVGAPDWLSVEAGTGVIRGLPPRLGDVPVTVEACDDAGEVARQSYTLHVIPLG